MTVIFIVLKMLGYLIKIFMRFTNSYSLGIIAIFYCSICYAVFPKLLAFFRTYFALSDLSKSVNLSDSLVFTISFLLLFLIFSYSFVSCVSITFSYLIRKCVLFLRILNIQDIDNELQKIKTENKAVKFHFVASLICIIIGLYSFYFINSYICDHKYLADKYIEDCNKAVKLIKINSDTSEVPVYSEYVPFLAGKNFDIEYNVMPLKSMGMNSELSIILTDGKEDHFYLTREGFNYIKFSDNLGIYSNDEKVLHLFNDNGFTSTRGFNSIWEVDLLKLANLNGNKVTEDNYVLIDKEHPITKNENFIFYAGHYYIDVELYLEQTDPSDDAVCRVEYLVHSGNVDRETVEVKSSDFNADNIFKKRFDKGFWTDFDGVEIHFLVNNESKVLLRKMTIIKPGD